MVEERQFFVVNMVTCEEEIYSKFWFGDEDYSGKIAPSDISVEAVKRKLTERGNPNAIVVKLEKDDSDYFAFLDPDADLDADRLYFSSLLFL